jgi:KDO2-lipid IV(A) lauroyltransferase
MIFIVNTTNLLEQLLEKQLRVTLRKIQLIYASKYMSQQQSYIPGEFRWEFLLPKYWKIWIAIIFLMLLAILPWAIQWRLAHGLAALCWYLFKSRRKTTLRNLEVCFPEWSPVEVEAQAKQVFVDMMLGVFETLNAWYCPNWFKGRHSIEGLEHILDAKAKAKVYYY